MIGKDGKPYCAMGDSIYTNLWEFLNYYLPPEVKRPISFDYVMQVAPLILPRIKYFKQAAEDFAFFFVDELDYDTNLLLEAVKR